MSFVHENPEEFTDLVPIIIGETGMGRSIIEKDYWVTHTLWALSLSGLDVWFNLDFAPCRTGLGHEKSC